MLGLGLKAQRRKPTTGAEGLVGEIGEVIVALNPEGTVRIHGEIWNAEAKKGKIAKGEQIRVIEIKDLKLLVELNKLSKE